MEPKQLMLFFLLAGASAVLATYPLDLVRTRLAYATEAPPAPPTQSGVLPAVAVWLSRCIAGH
jgi:hypothetical protein